MPQKILVRIMEQKFGVLSTIGLTTTAWLINWANVLLFSTTLHEILSDISLIVAIIWTIGQIIMNRKKIVSKLMDFFKKDTWI